MDTRLQKNPVYLQLNQRLRSALADFHQGDRFLSERQISETFEVSRATANKALASLVSEGLLEFRRGVGTFVCKDVIDYDVRSLVSFTEKARAAGKKPSTKLLLFEKTKARNVPTQVTKALQLPEDDLLWRIERIRLADRTPVIVERRFVVHASCPELTKKQARASLYQAWTLEHGLQIAGANEVIRAVALDQTQAEHLQVATGAPALEVVAVGFLENSSPLWWEQTVYRGDRYEFQSRLGPIQTATPARGALR